MLRITVFFLIILTSYQQSFACGGCGLFGNRCRYYKPAHVVPAVYPAQANVYVIQNAYPTPLIPPGSSIYQSLGAPTGYQGAVLPFLDPNRFFEQEYQLQKAASDTHALRYQRTSELLERIATLQAPAIERIAAGTAAQMVLTASGLNPTASPQAQQQAVIITRDAYGKVQVQPLTLPQLQALSQSQPTQDQSAPQAPQTGGKYPNLTQFCGKCHGLGIASPKKGLYLGDDKNVARVMQEKFYSISRQVSSKAMPPQSEPQPTDDQRAAILNEIEQIIEAQSKGGS